MSEITTVSIDAEDRKFLQGRGLSPSRILRKAIADLRDGNSREDYLRKVIKWQELYEKSRNFIDIRGLRAEFEKELMKE